MSYPPSAPPTKTCATHTLVEEERAQNSCSTEPSSSSSSAIVPSRTPTPTLTSPVPPSSQQRHGVAPKHDTPSSESVPTTEAPEVAAPSSSGMGASRRGLASSPLAVAGNSRAASRVRTYTALAVFAGVVPPTQPQQRSDLEHVL